MAAAAELKVKGAKELERAFNQVRKETLAGMRPMLRRLATRVKEEAENLAYNEITNIGADWWQMRVGVTVKGVYVAPKQRGSRGRGGGHRPNLAGLLMVDAMQPALDAHQDQIVHEFELLVAGASAKNGFLVA